MPQNCQIIGVNSVTNIELGKGVMPAPIIRNADWFESFAESVSLIASCCTSMDARRRQNVHAMRLSILSIHLYRIVAICRFTRADTRQKAFSGWMAKLFI